METETRLTTGNIPRALVRLSVPLLLNNLLLQLYNMADMLFISRLMGETAYSAIGVSASVLNFFSYILVGLCTGFAIPFASACGAGDRRRLRSYVQKAGLLGAGIAGLLSLIGLLGLPAILRGMHTPEALLPHCTRYLTVLFAGLICQYLYNYFQAVLQGVGRTDLTLAFLGISIAGKLGMDFLLIPRLGVTGAALATVFAQVVSAAACGFFVLRHLPPRKNDGRPAAEDGALWIVARFGLISALQQSGLYLGKLLIQGNVNQLGEAAISAFTTVTCIDAVLLPMGDSIAAGLAIFVAQNLGGGFRDRVWQSVRTAFIQAQLVAAGFLLLLPLRQSLVLLVAPQCSAEAMELSLGYLGMMLPMYFLTFFCAIMQGFFRGKGNLPLVCGATLLQITIRVIATGLLTNRWGLNAVIISCGIGWTAMLLLHLTCFVRDVRRGI